MAASVSRASKSTRTVTGDRDSQEGIVQGRRHQKRKHTMLSRDDDEDVTMTESKSEGSADIFLSGGVGQGGGLTLKGERKKRKKRRKKRMKANKPVQKHPVHILVDYELPSGVDRLSWDTDEVRKMIGEIA